MFLLFRNKFFLIPGSIAWTSFAKVRGNHRHPGLEAQLQVDILEITGHVQ